MDKIDSFHGEFRWLSNFWPVEVEFGGMKYPSVENAYQAAKTSDLNLRKPFVSITASESKKFGKVLEIRSDWDDVKLNIMHELLVQKFKDPVLKKKLKETGVVELVEGNWWGDVFWGVCRGEGDNHLGKLLMDIRKKI